MKVIVGFPKCGQNSLKEHFQCGYDELAWNKDGVHIFEKRYKDATPIFITRHPIDRCWSHYWFFKYNDICSYPNFLERIVYEADSQTTPIRQCDYFKYIERWEDLKPDVFHLEELQGIPYFPIRNANPTPVISPHEYNITKNLLLEKNIRHGYDL